MNPKEISFRSTNDTEIAINGIRLTKLFVPSIGSIIHVGSSFNSSFVASDSSAMNLIIKKKNTKTFSEICLVSITYTIRFKDVLFPFTDALENLL